MMNYKLELKRGEWTNIPHADGYVSSLYDIRETRTDQIVVEDVMGHGNLAKGLCRHLNMGGAFDGWTPAFFLNKLQVSSPE